MSENLEKRIRSRSIQKHDLEVNWNKATSFVPYKGEFIIYDIEVDENGNNITQIVDGVEKTVYELVGRTTPYTYERIKLGDGKTKISELPFIDNTSLKYIEQELTEAQKAQARANIDAAKTINSANISYVDGGGYPIGALEAYNQVDSTKQNLPVTVADIKAMLNNFSLNLAEMQRVMVAGSGNFEEQGCIGVLPIPRETSLTGSFSDLPLFTTPQTVSIAVRNETGALAVGDPISEDDATTKKYVDDAVATKVQKWTGTAQYLRVYANYAGTEKNPIVATTPGLAVDLSDRIAMYGPTGRSETSTVPGHLMTGNPVYPYDATNKNYVDTTFVNKAGDIITGDLTITGNLQIKGISETVDAVTYKVENNLIEFNPDKTYNNTWLTGIAINKGLNGETDLGTYGIMYDPSADSVKLGFGTISENHTFDFNENESAPIATREEFDDSWEDDAIFVFDKATKSFKYSGKTLSSFKEDIQDEMKAYMAQFIAEYVENYMSSETIVYPDGTTETNSDILYINGTTTEISNEDSSTTLYVEEE